LAAVVSLTATPPAMAGLGLEAVVPALVAAVAVVPPALGVVDREVVAVVVAVVVGAVGEETRRSAWVPACSSLPSLPRRLNCRAPCMQLPHKGLLRILSSHLPSS
jgi:hypothetical protein